MAESISQSRPVKMTNWEYQGSKEDLHLQELVADRSHRDPLTHPTPAYMPAVTVTQILKQH